MARKVSKKRRIIEIVVSILIVVIALFLLVFGYYWSKLSLIQYDDGTIKSSDIDVSAPSLSKEDEVDDSEAEDETSKSEDKKEKASEDTYLASDEDLEELANKPQDVVPPTVDIIEDDKVINVLLIATDEASTSFSNIANSDCMMIISASKKSGTVKLVSIERGTGVPIKIGRYSGQYDWINSMLRLGGPAMLIDTVEECFRIDIDGYVRVNSQTFIQIVNSCNGIDITLTQEESDYLNMKLPGSKVAQGHIDQLGIADKVQTVDVGLNHLNGETATLYARCRIIDDDWHRVQRQRNVIQSAISSTRGLSISELNTMMNNVLPLVQTNLSKTQITEILLMTPRLANASVQQMTLPQSGTYSIMTGLYGKNMFSVDFDANAKALQQFLYN